MNAGLEQLQATFGKRLLLQAPLKRYTTARIGGYSDALLVVESSSELLVAINLIQQFGLSYKVIGEGSNLLFSDEGFNGVILVNHARQVQFYPESTPPSITADSGVNLVTLARKAAEHGLSGLEWASGIPGSVGGAVYGNAGAHGKDMQTLLISASILHPDGSVETWPCERFQYQYRSSILKRSQAGSIVLNAALRMERKEQDEISSRMAEYTARRKTSQPTGASLGSVFKNPPGDHAGRLIETAGLKGYRIGGAVISHKHANFILNDNQATAADVYRLIRLAQKEVTRQLGVNLEMEIELVGDFSREHYDDAEN